MKRFYPALLWWRVPLWHVQVLDFQDVGGRGKTRQEALQNAQEALQGRVNDVADHQELPHPSHPLVAEAKLVETLAHGLELIMVDTKLEPEGEEINDSQHQGNKVQQRSGGRHAKRGGARPG